MGKTGLACIILALFMSAGCKKQKTTNEPRGPVGPPPIDQLECLFYRICLEDCMWANLAQTDFDLEGCHSTCAEDIPQEDLDANATLQSCLDEKCTDPDNFAMCQITECIDEAIACMITPHCLEPCGKMEELCSEEESSRNARYYYAQGQRVPVKLDASQVVIAWNAQWSMTPSALAGIDFLEHAPALSRRGMAIAHLKQAGRIGRTAPEDKLYPIVISPSGRRLVTTNRLFARFPASMTSTTVLQFATNQKFTHPEPFPGLKNVWQFEIPDGDALTHANRLVESKAVLWAHPHFLTIKVRRHLPADTYFEHQWHLRNTGQHGALPGVDLRSTQAWDMVKGDGSVIVGVYDDGVDWEHPDLNVTRDGDGNPVVINAPEDLESELITCCWHGTSVAGVAAALENDIGVVGTCPNCTVLPIFALYNVADEDGQVALDFLAAKDAGAAVMNNSWGPMDGDYVFWEEPNQEPMADVINEAITTAATEGRNGKGMVIFFASGNGNETCGVDLYVSHPHTLGVGAINAAGRKAFYSDFCDSVWAVAPSDADDDLPGIVTTDISGSEGTTETEMELGTDGDYTDMFGGTSSAAPTVAGVAALIISADNDLTANQVKDILRKTSRQIDPLGGQWQADADGILKSPFYGYGLVDSHAAVRMALIGCDVANADVCIPPAGSCAAFDDRLTEICNGKDDDCNGVVDDIPAGETCPDAVAACESCDFNGGCPGACVWLPDEDVTSCLVPCDDDACSEGYACQSGLCVPTSGRCNTRDEECDGKDNDGDGLIDENVDGTGTLCGVVPVGQCEFDGHCQDPNLLCSMGLCIAKCQSVDDCECNRQKCKSFVNRYGEPTDNRICQGYCPPDEEEERPLPYFFLWSCYEGCSQNQLHRSPDENQWRWGCVMHAEDCRIAWECSDFEWDL